jgi:hypothetical protein
MNESLFYIQLKSPSEYDYINGRVKILETYLFSREEVRHMTGLSFSELVSELLNSHYKEYILGKDFLSILKGISEYYFTTLVEMEKFVSPGFINSFFRSKEVFLKLKKLAVKERVDETSNFDSNLWSFIQSDVKGKYPEIFRVVYKRLRDNRLNPFKLNSYFDMYYIQFLLSSARKTESDFIKRYYEIFAILNTELILQRLLWLIKQNVIGETVFNEVIIVMREVLYNQDLLRKILSVKDSEDFEEFLRDEEMFYGVNEMFKTQPNVFIMRKLENYLDNGKFMIIGIEPVFIYLSKLSFELEVLKKLLYAKDTNLESQEILKALGFNYE